MRGITRVGRVERALCLGFAALFMAAVSLFASPAQANSKYAALVMDGHTGKVVFSRNADSSRYPASLTKIMTLYLVFEELEAKRLSLGTQMRVSRRAQGQAPSKLGLRQGQTIRVEDAILALVTKSANDVATVVAEHIGGTEVNFARMMTAKARDLGMNRTRFMNASGLPNARQTTTARDMATLGKRIREDFPQYYYYFSTTSFSWKGRTYSNHNNLLGKYTGTVGIKTGYTRASGFNLTAAVERDGKYLIGVVMGGRKTRTRDAHMVDILDEAWNRVTPGKARTIMVQAPVPIEKPTVTFASHTAPEAEPAPLHTASVNLPLRPPADSANTAQGSVSLISSAKASTKPLPGEPAKLDLAALPPPATKPQAPQQLFSPQSWVIQIGAYSDPAQAVDRIREAMRAAPGELSKAVPVTVPVATADRTLYRSRFGGFDEMTARNACGRLARVNISCIALPPSGWSAASSASTRPRG